MSISWSEIHTRALEFSKRWADASSERKEATPFWVDFFHIFDITNKRVAIFEHPATLADLYDPTTMPEPLLRAHQLLDVAVDKAYAQTCGGAASYKTDADRVAFLFMLYQRYISVGGAKARRSLK